MTKYRLYSIFDRNAMFYGSPVQSQNDEMMRRSVVDMLLMEHTKSLLDQHMYARYPGDFDVYLIGEYESDNGVISPVVPPSFVLKIADVIPGKGE